MTRSFAQFAAWILSVCLLAGAGHAGAQIQKSQKSLKDAMFGSHDHDGRTQALPKTAHFTAADGVSFTLDESGNIPLLRFDGDDEIFALTPKAGPKGDVLFQNDVGQTVLKSTRWGGMILFSDNNPNGDPAAVTGKVDAFVPGRMSPALLFQTLIHASRRVSLALGRNFGFDAPDVTPGLDYLYADAADVTSDALVHIAGQGNGKKVLAPIQGVQFTEGHPPSATVSGNILVLKLDPSRGSWGGHPSSKRIVNVIMASYRVTVGGR